MKKINRRAAIASVCGLGLIEKNKIFAKTKVDDQCRYIVMLHLFVGKMASYKAEAFVDRVKEKLAKTKPNVCSDIFVLPQRSSETKIEILQLGEENSRSKETVKKYIHIIKNSLKK